MKIKGEDKYEGRLLSVCEHICIGGRIYSAAASLLYLNTAVIGSISLIH